MRPAGPRMHSRAPLALCFAFSLPNIERKPRSKRRRSDFVRFFDQMRAKKITRGAPRELSSKDLWVFADAAIATERTRTRELSEAPSPRNLFACGWNACKTQGNALLASAKPKTAENALQARISANQRGQNGYWGPFNRCDFFHRFLFFDFFINHFFCWFCFCWWFVKNKKMFFFAISISPPYWILKTMRFAWCTVFGWA